MTLSALRQKAEAAKAHWDDLQIALAGNPIAIEAATPYAAAANPQTILSLLDVAEKAKELLTACEAADEADDLGDRVSGDLMSALRQALCTLEPDNAR